MGRSVPILKYPKKQKRLITVRERKIKVASSIILKIRKKNIIKK